MAETRYDLTNTVYPFTETQLILAALLLFLGCWCQGGNERQLSFFLIKNVVAPALKCNVLGMMKD